MQPKPSLLGRSKYLSINPATRLHTARSNPTLLLRLVGRMVVRLFELFEVSLNRVRGTYFCGERHEGDYLALRTHLNKSLGLEALQFGIVAHAVLNYSRSKFNAEVERLRRYLYKIEHGADIDLKRYYMGTEDMDSDHSPDRN